MMTASQPKVAPLGSGESELEISIEIEEVDSENIIDIQKWVLKNAKEIRRNIHLINS